MSISNSTTRMKHQQNNYDLKSTESINDELTNPAGASSHQYSHKTSVIRICSEIFVALVDRPAILPGTPTHISLCHNQERIGMLTLYRGKSR